MDKLFFVKATRDEMYDPGNIMPITHFLLYNQTQRIVVDITSDIKQAPLLSAVPEMQVMPEETVKDIECLMAEGVKKPSKGMDVRPVTYKKFECEELVGDQYEPVARAMVQLRDSKSPLDDMVESLHAHLISIGLVTPELVEEERKRIKTVDPLTLNSETRQRLEAIVETVKNLYFKAEFHLKLGNDAIATKYSKASLREDLIINVDHTAESLLHWLEKAERLGISEEERRNLEQQVYKFAHGKKSYDIELLMAKVLGLREEAIASIREKKLYDAMAGNWSIRGEETTYMGIVKEASDGVPLDKVTDIARKVYKDLMTNKGHYFGAENYLHAGQLANEFGRFRDSVIEASKKLIEVHSNRNCVGGYEIVEMAFTEFKLPEKMVHPLMLIFYERSLHMTDGTAQRIAERHPFSDEEISGVVNQAYIRFMQNGRFDAAIRLRQLHPSIIQDKVPIKDLKAIVGIMYFHQK